MKNEVSCDGCFIVYHSKAIKNVRLTGHLDTHGHAHTRDIQLSGITHQYCSVYTGDNVLLSGN